MPTICQHSAFAPNGRRVPHLPPASASTRADTPGTHRFSLTIAPYSYTSADLPAGSQEVSAGLREILLVQLPVIPHCCGKWVNQPIGHYFTNEHLSVFVRTGQGPAGAPAGPERWQSDMPGLAQCLVNGLLGGADLVKRGNLRMRARVQRWTSLSVVVGALLGAGHMERWGA